MIAILGVVAAIAAPRFFGTLEFRERFFADDVRAALSYAQKLAVASGCEVQVTINATGYELRQRSGCTGGGFTQDVTHPGTGAASYGGTRPPSVTLSSSESPILFDALGRARDALGAITDVTVLVGPRTVSAVGETGFVY